MRLVITIFLAIVTFFSLNVFSYFDITSLCRIKIHADTLTGDRATIKQAIKYLKGNSPSDYGMLCNFVSVINEKNCKAGDPRVDSSIPQNLEGCYIRGTKVIYIAPVKGGGAEMVRKRAELIKKYAQMSKEFWGKTEGF